MRKCDDEALRRVRKYCLSLPESSEVGSWGHPNFRAGKRTFAAYEWIKGPFDCVPVESY